MKKILIIAGLAALASPAFAADIGVSVNVGQPGFYGQINIGDFPQPRVIYERPVIIRQQVEYVGGPVYLRVPPGHEKHWDKHCASYNACGRPVYFVRDDWYTNEYAPHYRQSHGGGYDHDHDHGDDHGHDDDHGHGNNGHGNGHGNGNGNGPGKKGK
ncbi:MAG: hypothetical protein JWQ90_2906 [Hydrocarboniphaga sp.]|uniref:hypothetical protein n=1 Tax=Hydrocarboniphaga sp. TaxID=2033016 RepID=UPI002612D7C8|nr:hypothetical protein [Hydrocarboniphaga sp.]MDB5970456.1 hypothetical protein [Hydrocarboniphaga sp.]